MPQGTQPIGQSLYDFLDGGKQNGKSVYETSNMSENAQAVHQTIGYPPGQLDKLTVGSSTDKTVAITGVVPSVVPEKDVVVLGDKVTPAGKPDLVGSKSTVVTAPPELTKPAGGLADITPTTKGVSSDIFKSYKGKG